MYVEPIGTSGGLALWWAKEVTIHVIGKDKNFIDRKMGGTEFGREFFMTCVYGDPVFENRMGNWEQLVGIGRNRTSPWICLGDFNDISHHREKIGGR